MVKNNIEGYKCFNKNLVCNKNNFQMKEKSLYRLNKNVIYHKEGFHFCIRLEDTLRFFGGVDEEKYICKIRALGDISWGEDEYNGYYDMGCTNIIYIDHLMSREEIFNYADNLSDFAFIRLITSYKLNDNELLYFKNKYKNNYRVINYIDYYQNNELDVFYKVLKK